MLEDILGSLVRAQFGDLKRRTAGAVLEGLALGFVGLATVFGFIGTHLWLSTRIDPWLSAVLLALVALVLALVAMLAGRSLLRRRRRRETSEIMGTLGRLGLTSRNTSLPPQTSATGAEPGPGLVLAALAAGFVLGRSLRRK